MDFVQFIYLFNQKSLCSFYFWPEREVMAHNSRCNTLHPWGLFNIYLMLEAERLECWGWRPKGRDLWPSTLVFLLTLKEPTAGRSPVPGSTFGVSSRAVHKSCEDLGRWSVDAAPCRNLCSSRGKCRVICVILAIQPRLFLRGIACLSSSYF